MPQIPLTEAFAEARDRFIEITKLSLSGMVKVRDYADTERLTTPYAEVVIPALNLTNIDPANQDIEILPEIRLFCGKAVDGYDGALQQKISFLWLPSMVQSFIQYSNLCYPGKEKRPPWLDAQRTGLLRAQTILAGDQWLLVFYWRIVFKTKYQKVIGV